MPKRRCETCHKELTAEERRFYVTSCESCERSETDEADALDGDIGLDLPAVFDFD